MLLVYIAKITGALCAFLPERCVHAFCWLIGSLLAILPTPRRRATLSNLHHAFPDKPSSWHRKILFASMRRLVEMGLLSIAYVYFSHKRIRKIVAIPEDIRRLHANTEKQGRGAIALTPHFTLLESLSFAPFLLNASKPTASLFRPLDNPRLNQFIITTRERWGVKMLSRRDGFRQAQETLRSGGWVTIFFDQNAGNSGVLIPFFGRVASATHLPGILATKFNSPVLMAYPRRTRFWRVELSIQKLNCPCDVESITLASAQALEHYLKANDDQCADWLWAHNRWKIQHRPNQRLTLRQSKQFLNTRIERDNSKSPQTLQRHSRFWIRLPDNPNEATLALPLIKTLRQSRPDAAITLIAPSQWLDDLRSFNLAEDYIPLPHNLWKAFALCWQLRKKYPDTFLLLSDTLRGDIEAWLTRAPQRFGMTYPKRKRPLLTHSWKVPQKMLLDKPSNPLLWETCWRHFGLSTAVEKHLFNASNG